MAFAENYVDVAERIRSFRDKHPDGSLQQVSWDVREVKDKTFVCYTAAAYRTPDDTRPGIGTAWEPFPGPTPYTRDSELMNAETSAWGRAIIAAGAADAQRVASADEVRNRSGNAPTQSKAAAPTQSDTGEYVFPFGKHKGKPLTDVPDDYLTWLLGQPAKDGYEKQHAEAHAMYRAELTRREKTDEITF